MEENNRVKSIKKKFEGAFTQKVNKVENAVQKRSSTEVKDVIHKFDASNKITTSVIADTCTDSNGNQRAVVKRTPAFRRDKIPVRNDKPDVIPPKSSVVINRVHQFNKLHSTENVTPENNSSNVKAKPTLGKLEKESCNKNLKSMSELKNTYKNDLAATYTKGKKSPKHKLFKNKKPDDKTAAEMSSGNKENASAVKEVVSNLNEDLSDTLKRVLRAPLPTGPPPRKPPRMFIVSKAPTQAPKTTDFVDGSSTSRPSETLKLSRSKTEPEIMLKKIENALLKHHSNKFSPNFSLKRKERRSSCISDKSPNIAVYSDDSASSFEASFLNEEIYSKPIPKKNSGEFNTFKPRFSKSSFSGDEKLNELYHRTEISKSSSSGDEKSNDLYHIYEDPKDLIGVSPSEKENILNCSLYYMSTPIDSIINATELARLSEILHARNEEANRLRRESEKSDIINEAAMENKIKTWMNEAYSVPIKTAGNASDSSNEEIDSKTADEIQKDYDQVTLSRKGYVRRVASSAIFRQQSMLLHMKSDDKHLFECLLLIGLNLDASNNKVPYIKMKYPPNVALPQYIEHLCFPDAHDWSSSNGGSEKRISNEEYEKNKYTVTLTEQGGQRKYVYCRRIKPEGELVSIPMCYCILSSHKANEFYFMVLEEIEARHGKTDIELNSFIKELYENRFPAQGEGIKLTRCDENTDGDGHATDVTIKRPSDSRLEDLQLAETLEHLKINLFLLIISSMLLERKLILVSSSVSKLSMCVEGFQIALLPFQWQHTLITVVPSTIIEITDLCDAPTPYLIGLLKPRNSSQILPPALNVQQVIIVDIDEKKVLRKVGDEGSILPSHLKKGLKNALQLAHSSELQTNNLLACEAFTRLYVELLSDYKRYVAPANNNINGKKTFQKEAFSKAGSTYQIRQFREWFVETAAFSTFIETHLQNGTSESRGLFEQRCREYMDELNRIKYLKNNKTLNKTVRQIGGLFKDWNIAS